MDLRGSEAEQVSNKLMEESSTKRKAESDPEEEIEESGDESGDDDEYVDSEEELRKPTWWTAPEWDVDSYDGLEYHSSQEEDELTDEEAEQKWRRYKRLVIGSKGFYVEPGLRPMYSNVGIKPVGDMNMYAGHGQTYLEFFAEMACLCLQKYNHEKGFNVEFVQVVRGNYTLGSRSKSYVTFLAKEKPDGPLVEYQAKVWSTFKKGENYPILCRPARSSGTQLSNLNI